MREVLTRIILAISGSILIVFLIIHLCGLALALIDPSRFELYATTLHSASWMTSLELFLIVVAMIHIFLTIAKVISNFKAGNLSVLSSRRKDVLGVFASRSQALGGVSLLTFLVIHLQQLRFPRPADGLELSTVHVFLQSPITLMIYCLGSLSLFLHLFHGIESSHRSLGVLTPENASLIRGVGRSLSLSLGIGFVLVTFFL